jgi:hypothetical protein
MHCAERWPASCFDLVQDFAGDLATCTNLVATCSCSSTWCMKTLCRRSRNVRSEGNLKLRDVFLARATLSCAPSWTWSLWLQVLSLEPHSLFSCFAASPAQDQTIRWAQRGLSRGSRLARSCFLIFFNAAENQPFCNTGMRNVFRLQRSC